MEKAYYLELKPDKIHVAAIYEMQGEDGVKYDMNSGLSAVVKNKSDLKELVKITKEKFDGFINSWSMLASLKDQVETKFIPKTRYLVMLKDVTQVAYTDWDRKTLLNFIDIAIREYRGFQLLDERGEVVGLLAAEHINDTTFLFEELNNE